MNSAQEHHKPDDLIQQIRRDHQIIKGLFAAVEAARDHDERDRAFGDLMLKLAVHETAEQELLHPITRGEDRGGAEDHIVQEKNAEKLLHGLDKIGVDDADFDLSLERLRLEVFAHAESEELTELPLVAERVDAEQLQNLGTLFRAAEGAAPTRPHPLSPTSGAGNAVVGPFVAVADRVRDALNSNRG